MLDDLIWFKGSLRELFRGILTSLRGEGGAIGSRSYLGTIRHSYDGVQRTARPTTLGQWYILSGNGR
jgi:hypothetical protein